MLRKIRLLALAVGIFLVPGSVAGQNVTLTGYVRSDAQAPIPGAIVAIQSLDLRVVTNDYGQYLLIIPAAQANGQQVELAATSIGYSEQTVTVTLDPGTITQNLTLPTRAIALDEVVVTGTAGRKEVRAQAASIATINTARVAEVAPVTTLTGLLQARTPGLMIRNQSGSAGTAQTIRIRGISSITQGNEPLVFLDGIRIDASNNSLGWTGGQEATRLNDIKPEDIESIEVVKGPAAATLYGSDAVAGVINIITKKGRPGSGFTQTINLEYGRSKPNFTPPSNWGRCSTSAINRPDRYPNCQGQPVDQVLSDSPLERTGAFLDGTYRNLNYSLNGGGENYGVYFSLGADDDEGTLPRNEYGHITSRAAFNFLAREDLTVEFNFGISRVVTDLPQNDNNIYGYLGGGLLGDPRTIGGAKDGWYAPNRQVLAISSIENSEKVMRIQPRASVTYSPFEWWSNRLTVGADMVRNEAIEFWAKNDEGWWDNAPQNDGQVEERRRAEDRITLEYQGTLTRNLTGDLRGDLSFGAQALTWRRDDTRAYGQGLINNDVRSVDAAAILLGGGQESRETRDIGVYAQGELSWRERLYLQLGLRRDQSSTFGIDTKPFYSPKIGLSYVISDESYFQDLTGFLPDGALTQLRLRGAVGVSGRQPSSGARSTYNPSTNQVGPNEVAVGVRPSATGNPKLKAEKSRELEIGFDAGFAYDRIGMEMTYFRKNGFDQILGLPVPPSTGASGPQVNVGEILTDGWEISADARILTRRNLAWEVRASVNTVTNELIDLGGVPESATRKVGFPLNGAWEYRIREVDVANNRVIVSDTLEFLGNGQEYPGWETAFSTYLTLWENLTLYAQVDGRGDHSVYNSTDQFRDRSFGIGGPSILGCAAFMPNQQEPCSEAATIKYMKRFGPFYTESGDAVSRGSVDGAYRQSIQTFKLREVSLNYRLPSDFVRQYVRARSASFRVSMRNVQTWTNFLGLDPESDQFLSVPQDQRWTVGMTVTF
ncbi:MAG: SusC/RagA family TonB-linked outer membrane protein [Longimicrobiales bacterium]